jgi:predicted phosphodiesterase
MAIYGILGDIHGNLEALRAVLAAFDARGVQKILCVGDVVGYNADPDECSALLRARKALVIAGNHDLIGTGLLGFERCSNKARYSLARTRKELRSDTVAWLRALPASRLVESSIALVHGGVRDVQLYMTTREHIGANAEHLRTDFPTARVCFFGHSHEQKVYDATGEVQELPLEAALDNERLYFINAGSVDAQRKRSQKLAECAIFDSDAWTVDFLKIRYDAASTEAKAAVGGYRILPATDALYTWQRRAERLSQVAAELTRALGAFTDELLARRRTATPLQPR